MQTIRKTVKYYRLAAAPLIIYVCLAVLDTIFPIDYNRCDYYNERLNGGVKEFQGQKYKINICGTGGDSMQNNDEVRLQVFNEKGDLLAVRHFVVHWDTNFDRSLEYHPNNITYFDPTDKHFEKTLTMPPTVLDWIRARLPLLN